MGDIRSSQTLCAAQQATTPDCSLEKGKSGARGRAPPFIRWSKQLPTFPDRGYFLLVDRGYNGGSLLFAQCLWKKSKKTGTWRRPCTLKDVSDIGATLEIETSIEALTLNEFFLLSPIGLAYRCGQLERVNGDELQVNFIRQKAKARKSSDRR